MAQPIAVATDGRRWALAPVDDTSPATPGELIDAQQFAAIEREHSPRWIWWTQDTAREAVAHGVRPARCWDLGAVHRLLTGTWRGGPAQIWAAARGLDVDGVAGGEAPNLFTVAQDDTDPVRADGYLNAEFAAGGWSRDADSLTTWATLAATAYTSQRVLVGERSHTDRPAHVESATGLLCAELEHDGLPVNRVAAEEAIGEFIGPRPRDAADAAERIRERDATVLDHLPEGAEVDLRNPAQVRSLLRRVGIEVADTRAWRLESMRGTHPVVDDLLRWRKAERIATTFGYTWLDEHVGSDGRLRGRWSPSDGAAGRMTATAGLHNMPSVLRTAVLAEPGHTFVRADLGQIEPRVLAAVSGDAAFVRATRDDDLYAPVAQQLGVEREIAKVAVLGAMYGQTTGHGAVALAGLKQAYPTAMGYLREADHSAQGGHDLFTVSGRRIRMDATIDESTTERAARSRAAGRGRYGRNAVIQGAAAEFFKTWAALVRAQLVEGQIVLCLHDELLVHVPTHRADETTAIVRDSVDRVASQWGPASAADVRFVADVSVVGRWSDAK